jgi:hypothetical protein
MKLLFVSLLALATATTEAFAPSQFSVHRRILASRGTPQQQQQQQPIQAATMDDSTILAPINGSQDMPTTWECNDEAECVVVPACDEEQCRTSLDVRIHGEWYDLTGQLPRLPFDFVIFLFTHPLILSD